MGNNIELAKKLKALADRGIGGEKINAKKLLESLLKKHNLSIEDIEGEKTSNYFFNLTEKKVRLWEQIVKHVNYDIRCYGPFPTKKVRELALEGNYMIECTAAEYIEIEAKNSIYQKLFTEELNTFYHAFCTANDILANSREPLKASDLTLKEYEELLRVRKMAGNIKSEIYRKQIKS